MIALRTLPVLLALLPLGALASQAAPQSMSHHNPVYAHDFPDPMVLRVGRHNYYAYGTTVAYDIGFFPILHSSDAVHWTHVGDAFTSDPPGAEGDLWAPDVLRRGRTYYLYYTFLTGGIHCIGVATSSRPSGGFRVRRTVGCKDAFGLGWIDPDVFINCDGRAYLYVSIDSPHSIAVVPLAPNLLQTAGGDHELFGVTQPWEAGNPANGGGTVEGPFLVKRAATYYLFYSGNSYTGRYAMGVATASSPMGPFTKEAANPVLHGNRRVVGPGGGSVFTSPGGGLWMAYHAWLGPESYGRGGVRALYVDPIRWRGGSPSVTPTP